jgi:HEAT repeat protein
VVGSILINRLPGAEKLNVDRAELREWVESALQAQSKFVVKSGAKNAPVLHVRIGTDRPNSAYLSLQYEEEQIGELPKLEAARWIKFASSKDFRAAFAAGLNKNLETLADEVLDFNQREKSIQEIRAYASGKNVKENVVLAAIARVADRKDATAVKPLIMALKGPNIRVSLKAVAALGALGDPSSVDAITEFAERKIPEIRRHAIEAARQIGGQNAAAWLFTLSTGHSDAQVRNAARLALTEVERRLVAVN